MTLSRRFSDPTSPERRALTAAMRVALGGAMLVGCGGRVAPEHDGPAPAPTTSGAAPSAPATIPEASSERSPTPVPTGSTAPAAPGTSGPETSVPCAERLEAAFPDGGAPWFVNEPPITKDPALVTCCERIEAATAPDARVDVLRASGCCHVEFPGWVAACTPWGPPGPPAMPARVA
jgi:hypothetical protein